MTTETCTEIDMLSSYALLSNETVLHLLTHPAKTSQVLLSFSLAICHLRCGEINFLAPYVKSEGMLSSLPKNKNILKMKILRVAV